MFQVLRYLEVPYPIKIVIKAIRVSPKNMVFQIMDFKIAHATNFRANFLKTKVFQKLQPMFHLAKFVFDLTILTNSTLLATKLLIEK